MLYVREGPRGSSGARPTLLRTPILHSNTHNQTGHLRRWLPSGRVCAHPRPLWVSPTTSPVRLGVSPAATPTPTGAPNQRSEASFPPALEPWATWSALLSAVCPVNCVRMWGRGVPPAALPAPLSTTSSPALSVYVCECGAAGSASGQTACPVGPTLHQSQSRHGNASPLCPACPSLPLPVWMNVHFLFRWCRTSKGELFSPPLT